jgi:hypothetical protein
VAVDGSTAFELTALQSPVSERRGRLLRLHPTDRRRFKVSGKPGIVAAVEAEDPEDHAREGIVEVCPQSD